MVDVIHRTSLKFIRNRNPNAFPVSVWIHDPAPGRAAIEAIERRYRKLSGETVVEMSIAEKATADSNLLASDKADRIALIREDMYEYLRTRYTDSPMIMFALFLAGASQGQPTRRTDIKALADWVETVIDHFKVKKDAVNAAVDFEGVQAVTYDFTTFDATDPLKDIEESLAL